MSRLRAVQSYYTSEGLVELDDDVLGIVRQVNELYDGKVAINLDPVTGWFHFTEHGDDGTERLIFSVEVLDHRALTRLQESDSRWRYHTDPYDALEREQDEAQAQIAKQDREQLMQAGERLAYALKKEGYDDRLPLTVPMYGKTRSGH
jgi:hypothetical protein